ncbi:MAG: hypothetical protein Q7S68_03355, partial [Deltaproteobacteria bacterium]|nr:hypothetical protein [Deltaproteobacteria bacterium]
LFSFGQFDRDEISGEEYAKRILWSGGLGFLGGSVAGLAPVGSVRLFNWLNPPRGVAEGCFVYSVTSILAGFGSGGFAVLALSKAKESLFT